MSFKSRIEKLEKVVGSRGALPKEASVQVIKGTSSQLNNETYVAIEKQKLLEKLKERFGYVDEKQILWVGLTEFYDLNE